MAVGVGPFVHPQAHVSGSTIGDRTKVWQFASVIRGSIIGFDCSIGSCSIVDAARIGNNCLIGHGAQIHPGAVLGNDVFIGPGAVLCNDAWPCTAKDGFDFERLRGDFVTVEIQDGASIGANATVLPGVKIGKRALVAAGAVARTNVPDNHLLMRDGTLLKIKPEWRRRRMREAA